jgi:dipeptidyl aminopeptidase/acylaminoacyl peptidase
VEAPGHYTEPSFSPDGKHVVYRRTRGDSVRGQAFGTDPGIYVVAIEGGRPRLLREAGDNPRFSADGERVSYVERRGDKTALASVGLDGAKEVVHLESENAIEIVPSPDDRWVAFVERYKVLVAPFPRTGRAVSLGPGSDSVPVAELSSEAGFGLQTVKRFLFLPSPPPPAVIADSLRARSATTE